MKIAIITSRFPYPIEKGDKLRIYHQIKHLSKEHEIHLYSLSHQTINYSKIVELEKYCKTINIYKLGYFKTIIELIKNIFKKTPFQVAYFYNKSVKKKMEKEITEIQPNKIYYQLIRTAPYYISKYYSLMDFMDAFSLNYSRKIKNKNPIRNYFLKIETERLKFIYESLPTIERKRLAGKVKVRSFVDGYKILKSMILIFFTRKGENL